MDSNSFDSQENMPENHKMTKKEAFQLLDSLENDEKTLPLKIIHGPIDNRNLEKFW
jgi:hypothetical protein